MINRPEENVQVAQDAARYTLGSRPGFFSTGSTARSFAGSGLALALCLALAPLSGAAADEEAGTAEADTSVDLAAGPYPAVRPELATQTSNTRLLSTGKLETEISSVPINYETSNGQWEPIDTSLVPVEEQDSSFAVENAAADFTAKFPADADDAPVRLMAQSPNEPGNRGAWMSFKLQGMSGAAQVDNDTARYDEVRGASFVDVQVTTEGVKETIVLNSPPESREELEYTYVLRASPDLRASLAPTGDVVFARAGTQAAVFTIPVGNMFDSSDIESGSPESSSYTNNVEYSLDEAVDAGAWMLTVRPDMAWITDPDRAYPVMIDPTVVTNPVRDCLLMKDAASSIRCGDSAPFLRAGFSGGEVVRRSVLHFDTSMVPPTADLDHANVRLSLDSSQTTNTYQGNYQIHTTSRTFSNGATWATSGTNGAWNGGSPQGVGTEAKTITGAVSGDRYFNVTSILDAWVATPSMKTAFVLKQRSESVNQEISFASSAATNSQSRWPKLTVVYSDAPAPAPGAEDVIPGFDYDESADSGTSGASEIAPSDDLVFSLDHPDSPEFGQNILPVQADGPESPPQARLGSEGAPNYGPTWGACSQRQPADQEEKVVVRWKRDRERGYVGDYLHLNCGDNGYGFHHLLFRGHDGDYEDYSFRIGRNWRDLAWFSVRGAMNRPEVRRFYPFNDTFCHARTILVVRGRETVGEFRARVVVGTTGRRLLTTFPVRPGEPSCKAGGLPVG